jgi:hypothetical protein
MSTINFELLLDSVANERDNSVKFVNESFVLYKRIRAVLFEPDTDALISKYVRGIPGELSVPEIITPGAADATSVGNVTLFNVDTSGISIKYLVNVIVGNAPDCVFSTR